MALSWGAGRWPSEDECLILLKEAGCNLAVIAHVKTTAQIAVAMAIRINVYNEGATGFDERMKEGGSLADVDLVRAGALLHDIGRALDNGIRHAIVGAELAGAMGLPVEIIRIIERHVGAGLDASEAAELGLPARDFLPVTAEEKIVAHADNLAGKRGKETLTGVIKDLERKGLRQKIPRMEALHRELSGLCGMDIDDIRI